MDEILSNSYSQLIQALLSCPSGEEAAILSANQELLDADLVETMMQVANLFQEKGDSNSANFLIDIARQLAEPQIKINQYQR